MNLELGKLGFVIVLGLVILAIGVVDSMAAAKTYSSIHNDANISMSYKLLVSGAVIGIIFGVGLLVMVGLSVSKEVPVPPLALEAIALLIFGLLTGLNAAASGKIGCKCTALNPSTELAYKYSTYVAGIGIPLFVIACIVMYMQIKKGMGSGPLNDILKIPSIASLVK